MGSTLGSVLRNCSQWNEDWTWGSHSKSMHSSTLSYLRSALSSFFVIIENIVILYFLLWKSIHFVLLMPLRLSFCNITINALLTFLLSCGIKDTFSYWQFLSLTKAKNEAVTSASYINNCVLRIGNLAPYNKKAESE